MQIVYLMLNTINGADGYFGIFQINFRVNESKILISSLHIFPSLLCWINERVARIWEHPLSLKIVRHKFTEVKNQKARWETYRGSLHCFIPFSACYYSITLLYWWVIFSCPNFIFNVNHWEFQHLESLFLNPMLGPWTQLINWVILCQSLWCIITT
jgi:hypothetical protein